MSYSYQAERAQLFTEEGQVMLLKVRDNVRDLLEQAGAFRADKAWREVAGSSWQMLACLDRLVELGEIKRLTPAGSEWGQHEVFTSALRGTR